MLNYTTRVGNRAVLAIGLLTGSLVASAATVSIVPVTQDLFAGDIVTVEIVAADLVNAAGGSMDITWDSSVLTMSGALQPGSSDLLAAVSIATPPWDAPNEGCTTAGGFSCTGVLSPGLLSGFRVGTFDFVTDAGPVPLGTLTFTATGAADSSTLVTVADSARPGGGWSPPNDVYNSGTVNVVPAPISTLAAANLPTSRSVQVGDTATAFATVINTDTVTATGCDIIPLTSVPAGFSYQTTDPATNALTGTPNTPIDIAAGALQTYVYAFTPTAGIAPTDVQLSYDCTNTEPAPVTLGLNTLLLSASSTPVPDIVALAATPTGDGTVRLPGVGGSNAFAVASVNVGSTGTITATPGGGVSLPVVLSICETNPATGACLGTAEPSVTTTIAAGATPTFTIFATATGEVPFNPANSRIFVSFTDAGAITRGSTSVAVATAP